MYPAHTHKQDFYGTNHSQNPASSGSGASHPSSHKRPFLEFQENYHNKPEAITQTGKRYKQDHNERLTSPPVLQYIPSSSSSPSTWSDVALSYYVPDPNGSPSWDLSPHFEVQEMIPARQRSNAYAETQLDSLGLSPLPQTPFSGDEPDVALSYYVPDPNGSPSWDLSPHFEVQKMIPARQRSNAYAETQLDSLGLSPLPQTPFSGDGYLSSALGHEDRIETVEMDNAGHIEEDSDGDVAMHGVDVESPEICFGMIQDASITSSRAGLQDRLTTPDKWPGKRKKEKVPAIVPVIVQPQKLLTTIYLPSGKYVGLLDSRSSKGIGQLLALPSVRFQAFLPPIESIAEHTQQRQCQQKLVTVYINIYGPSHIIDSVGKILSNNEVYLQHPKHNEKKLAYKNPHYFTRAEDDNIRPPTIRLLDNVEKRIKSLFELSVNTLLPEIEPGNELKTPLLSHQKQAVYFMLQKEEACALREGHAPVSFWKQEKSGNGCMRYINSITKEIAFSRPQSVYGGILADEMGLGKSLTTLSLITSTMDQARTFGMSTVDTSALHTIKPKLQARATLIVAPASLLDSWREQINMHIKPGVLKVHTYHGAQRDIDPKKLIEFDIVITTYATIRIELFPTRVSRPRKSLISGIRWFRIVLDEAHIIREGSTQQSQALCLLEAQRRWCLTGTPIQNKLQDFGTLLRFLRVLPFNSEALFNRHIVKPLKMADPDGLRRLRMLIGSTCLRRNKNILDLPPRTDQIQYVHFKPADRHLYEDCKKDSARLIEYALAGSAQCPTYFGILQSILRLRQLCNHGKELLPAELGDRLGEYLGAEPPATESSHINNYAEIQDPNTLRETCLIGCDMCNEPVDPTEAEVGSFARCSHSICGRCSMVYEPDPIPSQLVKPSCPICTAVGGYSDTSGQANLRWMEGMCYSGPSTKVKALIENLRKFKAGGGSGPPKSVVFSCWTKMLDLIGLALDSENMTFVRFDGSLSIQQRKESIDRFREDPHVEILLISIGSGSVGLNLTAASRVHLMEPQWNPMVEQQALDRLHRIGQKKEVIAIRYIVKDSIEESILAFQQRKLALADLSLSQNSSTAKGNNEHLKDLRALFS